jgi:hypothetical protein
MIAAVSRVSGDDDRGGEHDRDVRDVRHRHRTDGIERRPGVDP